MNVALFIRYVRREKSGFESFLRGKGVSGGKGGGMKERGIGAS